MLLPAEKKMAIKLYLHASVIHSIFKALMN